MKTVRFSALATAWVAVLFLALLSAPAARAQTNTLALTVTANPSPAKPGEVVNYTFTVLNKGAVATGSVEVAWKVPNYATNYTPGSDRYQAYLNLAPGQSYTTSESYKIDTGSVTAGRPVPADGSLMTVTANAFLQSSSTTGVTAVGQAVIMSAPTLSVGITDNASGTAAPNQQVTYTVTVTNRGAATVASTLLSAPVPAGTTYLAASDAATLNGSTVQWNVGALATGAAVSRRYTVQAGSTAGLILAQATASDTTNGNNQAASSVSTTVSGYPSLGFTVTANPSPAKPGEVVNYTFTISNPGTVATDSVEIYWTVPNFVSSATPGAGDYVAYISLAPGQSYTYSQSYTVDAGSVSEGRAAPTDGSVMRLEAAAFLQGGNRYGAAATADVVIDNTPTLSVGIADDASGSAAPSQAVTYTLTATNRGSTAVANALLSAPLPSGTGLLAASDAGALVGGAIQWNVGTLAPGGSVSRRFTVQAGTAAGQILARGEVFDVGVPTNRAATVASTTVRTAPALGFTVTANPSPAKPGEVVNYTFTISNPTTVATDSVEIYWNVPNFVTGATPGAGDYVAYVSLAPGQSYTYSQAYTVDAGSVSNGRAAPADGSVMRLEARAFLQGGNRYGATAQVDTMIDSTPTLSVGIVDDTDGSAAPGQAVTYTVSATNRGAATVANAILSAPVPAGTTYVGSSDAGAVSDGSVKWAVGALAPGGSVSRRFTVQAGTAAGQILARGEVFDVGVPTNRAATVASTTVRTAPALGFTVTANPSPAKPGEVVNYTFTISNPTTVATDSVEIYWNVPNFVTGATPGAGDYVAYVSLAPGQSYTYSQSYTVATATVDGSVMRLEARAFLQGGNRYGATAEAEVMIDSTPTLSLGIADDSGGSAAPGQVVTYTLTTTNRGASTVLNPLLSLPVPSGATLVGVSDSGVLNGSAVQWSLGALPPGTFVTRAVSFNLGTATGRLIPIHGEVYDVGSPVNRATGTMVTTVRALPLLGLTVTVDEDIAKPGEVVNYTFTVTNLGNTAFDGGVEVDWKVPNFVSNIAPGADQYRAYLSVAPGQSYSFSEDYTVDAGSVSTGRPAAADGSVLRLEAAAFLQGNHRYGANASASVIVHSVAAPAVGIGGGTVSAQVGQTFSYQVQASNSPTTYTAGGLPSGLNINTATGLISGTPTAAGSFNVVLGATNEGGTGSATLTINVIPASPTITVTGGTVDGKVGDPLSYQIQASNLPAKFVASGLPDGLSVDAATGLISGTPTVAGTFNVGISATNPGGTGMTTLTFNIAPALPTVTLSVSVPQVVAGTGQNGAFLLTRTGDLAQDLIVAYQVKGSAVNGVDYVYLKGSAKLKAGKASKLVKVKPYGYGQGPGVKAVVRMVLLPSDAYTVGTPSTEKIKVKIIGQ